MGLAQCLCNLLAIRVTSPTSEFPSRLSTKFEGGDLDLWLRKCCLFQQLLIKFSYYFACVSTIMHHRTSWSIECRQIKNPKFKLSIYKECTGNKQHTSLNWQRRKILQNLLHLLGALMAYYTSNKTL